jgi:exopolysaccharide biosynthesis protein
MIVDDVDTEGQASFATARHPRTAVGIADSGKRLVLVVVDGRQPTFSAGMSLRETAVLMRALGAREAINLDGGGSSAMVYADPALRGLWHIANRPSDPTGERAVGNALAIVKGCRP